MIIYKNRHFRKILVIIIGGGIVIWSFVFFVRKDLFLSEAISALFGLLVGLLLYEISLLVDDITENKKTCENTRYVYELYKIEIENNINHINNMTSKRWVPFYRLQTNARDKLWGELADYSKDINFMKQINRLYNEYELINNKIEIMNSVRLQLAIRPYEEISGQVVPEDIEKLNAELSSQLEGCIGLGEGANKIAEECLKFISDMNRSDNKNIMGEKSIWWDIGLKVIGCIIVAFLSVMGTLYVQSLQTENMKKDLHRKVFEEIKHNSNKGILMERTGKFKVFQVNSWESLVGSPAFYDIPLEIRKSLDSYYTTLKCFNEGLFEWKKLNDKEIGETTVKDLIRFTEPYQEFLVKNNIIPTESSKTGINERKNNLTKVFVFPEQFPVYTAEYDKNGVKTIREITIGTITNDLNEILEQIDDTHFQLAWLTRAKCALLLQNVENKTLEEYSKKYKDAKKEIGWEEILNAIMGRIENDPSLLVRKTSLEAYKIITSRTGSGFDKNVFDYKDAIDHWKYNKINILKELKQ